MLVSKVKYQKCFVNARPKVVGWFQIVMRKLYIKTGLGTKMHRNYKCGLTVAVFDKNSFLSWYVFVVSNTRNCGSNCHGL